MGLAEDLKAETEDIFRSQWETREGTIVPSDDSLKLTNDGIKLKAAVLYADLAESTKMVDSKKSVFAAEVYKAFLRGACRVIRSMNGSVTAFDGDRVMAIFIGETPNSDAVKTGLKINCFVRNVLNSSMKTIYPNSDFVIRHGVGIDSGELLVARTGIRGANDLVWVGPSANYAAKLATLRDGNYNTWITQKVFDVLSKETKYSKDQLMWETRTWTPYGQTIYRSSYWWHL